MSQTRVAIIGGGAAGVTAAMRLGQIGIDVTIFEREQTLVSGPPFCHLHAGGNLYREISDQQCIALLKQSIDFLKYYPWSVDYRPTVIAVPTTDPSSAEKLIPRLKLLQNEYRKLIKHDATNEVLGKADEYFKLYSMEDLQRLQAKDICKLPKTSDEWMIPVAQNIDLSRVQFPIVLVQEYGLNLFRLGAGAALYLESLNNVTIKRDTKVTDISRVGDKWQISFSSKIKKDIESYDYLINAAGFRTGEIDDMLGLTCKRMVEFKAAYVTRCDTKGVLWPEVIFHGERGTPRGMAQFTPYPDGHFQLHGMTTDITLFEGGLAASSSGYAQPKLDSKFVTKIENGWQQQIIEERTKTAIKHLAQFIPSFASAKVAAKPLYGAQQIPGNDPDLRVAEVSFPTDRYARCEIVKVSSVLDMADTIIDDLLQYGFRATKESEKTRFDHIGFLKEQEIDKRARKLCRTREYPEVLAGRCVSR